MANNDVQGFRQCVDQELKQLLKILNPDHWHTLSGLAHQLAWKIAEGSSRFQLSVEEARAQFEEAWEARTDKVGGNHAKALLGKIHSEFDGQFEEAMKNSHSSKGGRG